MPGTRVWAGLLGVENTVIEDVSLEQDEQVLVFDVRPRARWRKRCGVCRRKAPSYDRKRRRRWRHLDFGAVMVFLEADAPRVRCKTHGVVVAHVPWARHRAGHTTAFDAQVAWLVTKCSKSAVCELMRIAWRSVGVILHREYQALDAGRDRLAGLERIGIDEVSYKKGHRYLTVVVDHDSGRLVWAAEGRDTKTLNMFFEELGEDRCAQITHISADGAGWITKAVQTHCPEAVFTADPFHIVQWATQALDEVRRGVWRDSRTRAAQEPKRPPGRPRKDAPPRRAAEQTQVVKNSRYPLLKNPENLTEKQAVKLDYIAKSDPRLHRAYLLKEKLRMIFQLPYAQALDELEAWIQWARRSRIPEFVKLQRSITAHKPRILAAIEHGLSNGRIESVNTKIRLMTRVAFGFHSSQSLIALAMLTLSGLKPQLPGRAQ